MQFDVFKYNTSVQLVYAWTKDETKTLFISGIEIVIDSIDNLKW